jgi:hypothetical protein
MRVVMRVVAVLVVMLAGAARRAVADPAAVTAAFEHARAPISITADGRFAGAGADSLRAALANATFVMLGEDHGIAQIPSIGAALCAEVAPLGFARLALEVGPSVAPQLAGFARAKDGAARTQAFSKQFPETIAFYEWREEQVMLAACARAVAAQGAGRQLELWGLDQELMGATGFLLQNILDSKPGPEAKAAIEQLAREAAADRVVAAKTGDYGKLFMVAVAQDKLDAARVALAHDGSAAAQQLFASLLESRTIYLGQSGPDPYASNRERARLMKRTFFSHLNEAARAEGKLPKVMVKLGAWHLYRGLNPLRSSELGNLIAEAAEAHEVEAVNVLVLGVKGQQLRPAGVARASQPVPLDLIGDKDSDFAFLAPVWATADQHACTLFDLRALRSGWGKLGADHELERMVFGYDFLILVAEPKPEHSL